MIVLSTVCVVAVMDRAWGKEGKEVRAQGPGPEDSMGVNVLCLPVKSDRRELGVTLL